MGKIMSEGGGQKPCPKEEEHRSGTSKKLGSTDQRQEDQLGRPCNKWPQEEQCQGVDTRHPRQIWLDTRTVTGQKTNSNMDWILHQNKVLNNPARQVPQCILCGQKIQPLRIGNIWEGDHDHYHQHVSKCNAMQAYIQKHAYQWGHIEPGEILETPGKWRLQRGTMTKEERKTIRNYRQERVRQIQTLVEEYRCRVREHQKKTEQTQQMEGYKPTQPGRTMWQDTKRQWERTHQYRMTPDNKPPTPTDPTLLQDITQIPGMIDIWRAITTGRGGGWVPAQVNQVTDKGRIRVDLVTGQTATVDLRDHNLRE